MLSTGDHLVWSAAGTNVGAGGADDWWPGGAALLVCGATALFSTRCQSDAFRYSTLHMDSSSTATTGCCAWFDRSRLRENIIMEVETGILIKRDVEDVFAFIT